MTPPPHADGTEHAGALGTPGGRPLAGWLPPLVLVGCVLLFFGSVVRNGFVAYDDQTLVYANPHYRPVTWKSLAAFWRQPYEHIYVPATYTFWGAQARLAARPETGGSPQAAFDPAVFHTASLLLHAANVLLAWRLLRRLVGGPWAAAFGALLFALHPVQVESVAWISEQKGLLCAFFSLLALNLYLSDRRGEPGSPPDLRATARGMLIYTAATLCLALAFLSKPSAIAVPPIAAVLAVGVLRRPAGRVLMECAPWAVLSAGFIAVTMAAQPGVAEVEAVPILKRPLVMGDAAAFYLWHFAVPLRIGVDYGRSPSNTLGHAWVFLTAAAPVVLLAAAALLRPRRWLAAAIAVPALWLLPVSGLMTFHFQRISVVADRYLYLALLGPALILGRLLTGSARRTVWVAAGCWLAVLGVRSSLAVPDWRDSRRLFERALAVNPRSTVGTGGLCDHYVRHGEPLRALEAARARLALGPSEDIVAAVGDCLVDARLYREAARFYDEVLARYPDCLNAHFGAAMMLLRIRRLDLARTHFETIVRLDPTYYAAQANLAFVLERQGHLREAVTRYRMALATNPDYVLARYPLGALLARRGDLAEALHHLVEASRLDPGNADIQNELGQTLLKAGRPDEARAHLLRALELAPGMKSAEEGLEKIRGGR